MSGDYARLICILCLLSAAGYIHNTVGIDSADSSAPSFIESNGACDHMTKPRDVLLLPGRAISIYSPGFPKFYTTSTDCVWRIATNLTKHVIHLVTELFQFYDEKNTFRVFDGDSESYPILLEISSVSLTRNITTNSSGQSLYVTFSSVGSRSNQGFRFNFKVVPVPATNISLACTAGTRPITLAAEPFIVQNIRSPGYPNNYSNNANCEWLITAGTGYVISLHVVSINLEPESSCSYDYVEVFDGNGSSPRLSKLCSSSRKIINSTGQMMTVRFISDKAITAQGFFLQYRTYLKTPVSGVTPNTTKPSSFNFVTTQATVEKNGACGQSSKPLDLYALPGNVTSIYAPGFPAMSWNFFTCAWRITTNLTGYVIQVTTVSFELDNGKKVFKAFDGDSAADPLLLQISSMSLTRNITSHSSGQSLYVTFSSDGSVLYNDFRFNFTAIPSPAANMTLACPSGTRPVILVAEPYTVQNIRSPGYPKAYPNDAKCEWLITTGTGYVISLYVVSIKLETESACSYDYVEVFDGKSSSPRLSKLCNSSQIFINSTGQTMLVRFVTDSVMTSQGFFLQYRTFLKTEVLDVTMVTAKPSSWNFTTPRTAIGNTVTTATTTPPSSSIVMTTEVSSDLACSAWARPRTQDASLFREQTILSPGYPFSYPNSALCEWVITAGAGYVIRLSLQSLDLETSSACSYDYVVIFDGSSSYSPQISKLCTYSSGYIFSSGQSMFVRFVSDSMVTKTGFVLLYTAIPGVPTTSSTPFIWNNPTTNIYDRGSDCRSSGLSILYAVSLSEKHMEYSGIPYSNPSYGNCVWMISLQQDLYTTNSVIQLTVLELTYVRKGNGYITIYDGSTIYDQQIFQKSFYSDQYSLPVTKLYSTRSTMLIKLYALDYVTLKVSYKAVLRNSVPELSTQPNSTIINFQVKETTNNVQTLYTVRDSNPSFGLIFGTLVGALLIVLVTVIVIIRCRHRPKTQKTSNCTPPAITSATNTNALPPPGSQCHQMQQQASNGVYTVPAPDPNMPRAIYPTAPPCCDDEDFTPC